MNDNKAPILDEAATPQAEAPTESADTSPEAARREVLKRLGVYGALVTPALLTVLTSSASAQVIAESGATN